ncbi:probable cytochrome P450 304a1 isoform X2 [Cephus cinctus]|uniref:Probable cytochrome P450 304a1 isoform X2 n=1 Tax=Cephus cinctus TaxID=211228 RepID=A0AAJ7RV97_CEPCN|nr:probable cytochrome P450 304a1 isoform X2 [Cephus cinctus]
MSYILILIILWLLIYKGYKFVTGKPPNTPPAIPRIPIWGSYWFLLWVAQDSSTCKELLNKKEFDGRIVDSDYFKARAFGKQLGIFFVDGSYWQEQRRFALRHMRDFGFGRRQEKWENDVLHEVSKLIEIINTGAHNDEEKTVLRSGTYPTALFPDILFHITAGSIWAIISGEKIDRDDHEQLRRISRAAMTLQRNADTLGGAILQTPWLRHFGNIFGYKKFIEGNKEITDYIREYVDERVLHGMAAHREDDSFIDRYLRKIEDNRKRGSTSSFSRDQLLILLTDFMFPSLSALPSSIATCIKYMMHFPEVKKKVQDEIDSIVGPDRLPILEDRKMLPYTEATIRELLRYETSTPLGVPHVATENTLFCGYSVPANTIMLTNLAAMHHEPELWGDPYRFRPERFLNANGELYKDPSLPFSAGHRVCAGETFSRFLFFLIFSALMQNYDPLFVPGEPSALDDNHSGLIVTPKDAWIQLKPRA